MEKARGVLGYFLYRVFPFAAVYLGAQVILRSLFLLIERVNIDIPAIDYLKVFAVGSVFDLAAFVFMLLPYVLYLWLLPKKAHMQTTDRLISFVFFTFFVVFIIFISVGEWLFWAEFSNRYNFIAVDYLVYTHEVIGNILESYNIPLISFSIVASAVIVSFVLRPLFALFRVSSVNVNVNVNVNEVSVASPKYGFALRSLIVVVYGLIAMADFAVISQEMSVVTKNNYANEAAKNGLFSLFSAFRNNNLPYDDFFVTAYGGLGEVYPMSEEELTKTVMSGNDNNNQSRKLNVIVIVMESLSASFMNYFGGDKQLTPNLDWLSKNSLFFESMYATGTRTVRGLEAISLSMPPVPGRSIIKRPGNEGLCSIGSVFKDLGYDTKFLYGGYGYFDNMNYFFANNDFEVIDRTDFSNDITFANIWGCCDQDLYKQVIKQAKRSYVKNKPFMHIVMNTSNHRPYTFPKGIPGVPENGGMRKYGVMYADYAIGEFLRNAKKEPWFKDTIFVIVADHTANSAGKLALTPKKHHIPMFIYAPHRIKSRIVKKLCSQVDIAPTILGLLGVSYRAKFFGQNILSSRFKEVAFISNYQNLGFMTSRDSITILQAGKKVLSYNKGQRVTPQEKVVREAIKKYRTASRWDKLYRRIDTRPYLQ